MKVTPSIHERICRRIDTIPPGEPFTPSMLLDCGTRASVDQTLSRLSRAGTIERVARGVFVRPETNRFIGKVMPSPRKVAEALGRSKGAVVQVHGAEAARQLQLTTQVPTQPSFLTSGPSRRVRLGNTEIRLQHTCRRKLALAGRPAGLALAALWYLGKHEVTPAVIEKIRHQLGASEFSALQSAMHAMPGWMSDAIFHHMNAAHG